MRMAPALLSVTLALADDWWLRHDLGPNLAKLGAHVCQTWRPRLLNLGATITRSAGVRSHNAGAADIGFAGKSFWRSVFGTDFRAYKRGISAKRKEVFSCSVLGQ